MTTISVVIPIYNGEKYIERAILSTLSQSRKPDEIIVHDDNSTDSTLRICEKYISEIKYYFNPDGPSGFVNGWNRAIALATSDFIVILHQDDLLYPTFLEEAEQALNKNPDVRHLFTLCDYIGEDDIITNQGEEAILNGKITEKIIRYTGQDYVKAYQKSYNGIPHIHRCPGVITHRSIFEAGIKYNPEAGHIADDDFFYRVGQYTPVIGIMKSLAAFRIHEDSETGKIGDVKLVTRLAQDYIFQVNQWYHSNFLDNIDKSYFEYWAIKYVTRINYYAFKTKNKQLKQSASQLINKLEHLKFVRSHIFSRTKLYFLKLLNWF